MKKRGILVVVLFLMIPLGFALQSEEYIDEITNVVFDGCKGLDIKLKENFFIRADNKGFVPELKWPYEKGLIKALVQYISKSEPYAVTSNMFMGGDITLDGKTYSINNKGEKILVCGENHLDVYSRDYIWNGMEIDLPRYVTKIETQTGTLGNEDMLTKAYFESFMISSEAKGRRDAFFIAIVTGIGTGLLAGILAGFIINYLFATPTRRKEVKKIFKKRRKNSDKKSESPE